MALQIEALTISTRGGQALFAPLTLTVTPATVVTVMGPSGVGKSTLLDAIAGHLVPGFVQSGRIWLGGRNLTALPAEARGIGMMFQDAVMFGHLSVGDNLAFGLTAKLRGRAARRGAVEAALQTAGLGGFYNRDPATLSGGQRARAALMRTLLAEPQALLLDEPFSRLDAGLRAEIRSFVFDHARARALPVLLVTHDGEDAAAAAGPVVQL
ncbi:ATP-binding cassette domain-containing protein [Cypionkella sp.]|uniref:ATP-binding cassette domain-containing protein n=1 Tax=Cypionkella sp. TaxID=2811411 RepID=UPI003752F061